MIKKSFKFISSKFFKADINYLVSIFIAVQVLDGVFTYRLIKDFGIDVELNPLIKVLLENFDPALSLIFIKVIAVTLLLLLRYLSLKYTNRTSLVVPMLNCILAFYLIFAVVPMFVVIFYP